MLRSRLGLLPAVLAAALLAVCGVFGPASAHDGPNALVFGEAPLPAAALAAEVLDRAAPPAPASDTGAGPGAALVAALAAAWLVRRSPRRALALALILLLAVLAFETGIHSVHHGVDKRQLASCQLSAASAHLSATAADGAACTGDISHEVRLAPSAEPAAPIARPLSAHRGRAPPLFTV